LGLLAHARARPEWPWARCLPPRVRRHDTSALAAHRLLPGPVEQRWPVRAGRRMSTIEGQTEGDPAPRRGRALASSLPWRVWRSPPDQPSWARPALLVVAGLACLAYAWDAGNVELEPFYGAAARSMSESWHDFVFGAFDPAGTLTVDKLPGALWPQALSLRLFGFHAWAVVLPQIVAGVLTVLVLYRAVRRLAGPTAGIVAAVAMAVSPVTVALNRGNVADSLLILLTVLAADATSAALLSGRRRSLLLAGVWVGLAFQTKMVQAWLILPALALAFGLAAPDRLRIRARSLALAGAVTLLVSLSWMTLVSLIPASERPYVDGTRNDSVFTQVFNYNGVARLGLSDLLGSVPQPAAFLVKLGQEADRVSNQAAGIKPSWHRLLGGLLGRTDGWLLPAALISAVGVLLERRGADRRDPLRACVLLWGTWLLVLFVFFSVGDYINSYYVAALSPATAALCGVGVGVFWRKRLHPAARACLAAALLGCTGYGAYLLQGGTGVPGWLLPVSLCFGIGGALAALLVHRLRGEGRSAGLAIGLVLACALPATAITSVLTVTRNLGPFAVPYSASAAAASRFSTPQALREARLEVDRFSSVYHTPIPFAIDSSLLAGPYIFATGKEIVPIGGNKGGVPAPSLSQLQDYITSKQLRAVLVPIEPPSADPRVVWVRTHCAQGERVPLSSEVQLAVYDCTGG
jgi:4-amino-4-deoxy-L-arabinose transferase-like glycosyltransferase